MNNLILVNENGEQRKANFQVLIENDELKITQIVFIQSFEKDTDKFHFEKYNGDFDIKAIEYLDTIVGHKGFGAYKEVRNNGFEWILIEYKSSI
ncbi:hypothetical protein VB264_09510 [Arcicella aquatica]|uniref:Uncharacterized protein n=1 Tax=Arcicella aquatica TaxID=217141 RepID=A0ABU5QM77_9BACT|nr:hypothetical protein [Arcicella aquatica]MEA5258020.1 hypothetical protein [Arcicella aquatica]